MSIRVFVLLFALKVIKVSSFDQCDCSPNFEICKNNSQFEPTIKEEVKFESIFHPRHAIDIFELWKDFPKIFIPKENVSENCAADIEKLFSGVKNMDLWALKMLDASAKLPSGILNGNANQYGDFDQCLSVKNPVRAKYCLASLDFSLKTKHDAVLNELDSLIHSHHLVASNSTDPGHRVPRTSSILWGVCLPESCSAKELQISMEKSLVLYQIQTLVNDDFCMTSNSENDYSIGKFFAIIFFIAILFLNCFGTVINVNENDSKKPLTLKLISQFSMKNNINKFFDTTSEEHISGLDGIRALNALGLYISHKSFALFYNPYVNKTQMIESLSQPWSVAGRNAIVYTDSFLLISGFLTARSFMKDLKKYNKIQFFKKFINRLFRFVPVLLSVILFSTYILPDMSKGPQAGIIINEHSRLCKKNMWKNFLFIHNFFGFENMCLTHTHQLGIDMQLFFMCPLAVLALWYLKEKGIYLLTAMATCSTFLRFSVISAKKLSMGVYTGMPVYKFFDSANYSYILPTHRSTIYIMGILLAHFMIQKENKMYTLSRIQIGLGWTLATCLGLLALIGTWHITALDYEYNELEAAYYGAFEPILWGSFIAWTIWACNNNYGGKYNNFLSWRGFKIFTKISYGVYLTQFPIFFYNIAIRRHVDYFTIFSLINIPELFMVLAASFAVTILVEIPLNNINKILI